MCFHTLTMKAHLREEFNEGLQSFDDDMTRNQINDTFLFHRVIKILTGGRILQISIAWCQIEAEIRSFPTMYGKGGYMW